MVRLLAWLSGGLALLLAAAAGLVVAAVEDVPLVPADEALAPAAVSHARELLRRNDPRRLARGETRKVDLTADDLGALLQLATRRGLRASSDRCLCCAADGGPHYHVGGVDAKRPRHTRRGDY